jgi:hypothetical protein
MAKSSPKVRPITAAQVLAWADAWHAATGDWPGVYDGPVPGAGASWLVVHRALNAGTHGLPAGGSLAKLRHRECGRQDGRRPLGDPVKRAEAQHLRAEGWTLKAIGAHFGVNRQAAEVTLRRAAVGRTRPGRKPGRRRKR